MKQKLSVLIVLASMYASMASGQTISKNEFDVVLPVTKVAIARGQMDTVDVSIIRSRYFTNKGEAQLKLASSPKAGIEVSIERAPGKTDAWVLAISVGEAVQPGNYTIIPSCTLHHKVKGAVLSVIVN